MDYRQKAMAIASAGCFAAYLAACVSREPKVPEQKKLEVGQCYRVPIEEGFTTLQYLLKENQEYSSTKAQAIFIVMNGHDIPRAGKKENLADLDRDGKIMDKPISELEKVTLEEEIKIKGRQNTYNAAQEQSQYELAQLRKALR